MIKRELRRRSAVEPVIGHLKAEHLAAMLLNAILVAAGYSFRRLRILLRQILSVLLAEPSINPA
jgi:IS5 family transposase